MFYIEKLGLPLISKTKEHFSVQAGWSTITFKRAKGKIEPQYHFAFNIPKNQLQEAFAWMSQRATIIPVDQNTVIADFDNWNAKSFYFYDPVGNILECLTRFDLDNESSRDFNSGSFLCVSEIAVVTDNVTRLADTIHCENGLDFFSKQPRHENFTVMGDDRGLLIISEQDRHWYPTQQLAKRFPVSARVSDFQRVYDLTFNYPS